MKCYKISGGPSPINIKIEDPDGKDITSEVIDMEIIVSRTNLMQVKLTFFAEIDVEACCE